MKFHSRQLLTLIKTFNMGSLRFWKEPSRFVQYLREVHTVYLSLVNSSIRPVNLSELLGDNFQADVFLPFSDIKPGSTPLTDLAALASIVRKKFPKKIFEIGTFEGLTSVVFTKNSGPEVKIFTLDLPPKTDLPRTHHSLKAQSVRADYASGYLIDSLDCSDRIERLYGDSALFDFKRYENSIDLFFIDGAHTAEYVANDSLSAFRSIVSNGWVIWHDCFIPDVFRVVKRIASHHPVYQIIDTRMALAVGKPGLEFPWRMLESKIR